LGGSISDPPFFYSPFPAYQQTHFQYFFFHNYQNILIVNRPLGAPFPEMSYFSFQIKITNMILGVSKWLGDKLGWNVTFIRIAFVVATLFYGAGV